MSSSKSSQSSSQAYTDNRAVLGEGSTYADDGGSVTSYVLDGGAIQNAFQFGEDALLANTDVTKTVLGTGVKVLDAGAKATALALDNMQSTQQLTADAYADAKGRGALTDKILIGTVLGALAVALVAVFRGARA